MLTFLAAILVGYLLGSIPASVIVGRLRGVDIRHHGSGNPGASNVLRVLGLGPAVAVLAVDVAKGALAAWFAGSLRLDASPLDPNALAVAGGAAAVVGHVWPVWLGLRGGKGVATALGVALVLAPLAAGLALAVFVLCVAVTRRVSVGSLMGATAFALALVGLRVAGRPVDRVTIVFGVGFALAVFWTHRSNIRNLLAGTEPRIRVARGGHEHDAGR